MLKDYPRVPTIEGPNGIGKTSLVNVALHVLYEEHLAGHEPALYIPCSRLQLTEDTTVSAFCTKLFFGVAQSLFERKQDLLKANVRLSPALDRWLNAPELTSPTLGFSFGGIGLSGSRARGQSSSTGFSQSGFRVHLESLLKRLFPEGQGGVVCLIDNLELLRYSDRAKEIIEGLRDELFDVHGIRCVLCGSHGIVQGAASSSRLSGVLHQPVVLGPVAEEVVTSIFRVRVNASREKGGGKPYLPLTEQKFAHLFELLKGNMRDTLANADSFCLETFKAGERYTSEADKDSAFLEWITEKALGYWFAIKDEIRMAGLQSLLKRAVEIGRFARRDKGKLGIEDEQLFDLIVDQMVQLDLLEPIIDPTHIKREFFQVTPKGCFIDHYLVVIRPEDSELRFD